MQFSIDLDQLWSLKQACVASLRAVSFLTYQRFDRFETPCFCIRLLPKLRLVASLRYQMPLKHYLSSQSGWRLAERSGNYLFGTSTIDFMSRDVFCLTRSAQRLPAKLSLATSSPARRNARSVEITVCLVCSMSVQISIFYIIFVLLRIKNVKNIHFGNIW